MDIRERNVEIFNDTMDVIKHSEKLTKSVEEILKKQKLNILNHIYLIKLEKLKLYLIYIIK